jgi:NAD(P)-dependent dehydrogenase (short-subunit alcohol dehydrogenase family)
VDDSKTKVAVVLEAGSRGPGWGNGKAAAVLFAREGAKVLAVDVRRAAAEETSGIIAAEGGDATSFAADVSKAEERRRYPLTTKWTTPELVATSSDS